jgi:hypothetical protein
MDSAINVLRRSARLALAWAAMTLVLAVGVIGTTAAASEAATQTAKSSGPAARATDANGASPAVAYLLVGVIGTGAAFTGRRVQIRRFD